VHPADARRPVRTVRGWKWTVLAVLGVALVVIGGLVMGVGAGLFHPTQGRGLPQFPSLTEQPDDSLQGTVAYFAGDAGCVRIIAASGRSAKDVLCIPPDDLAAKPEQRVKPVGPQLVWLPDNRLEVTMFAWTPKPGTPVYSRGWQKIVDVRTGNIDAVPPAKVPSTPNTTTGATVSPKGERVNYTLDAGSGHVTVKLTTPPGITRTLLSVRGPGEYTYGFGPVFWAPNWKWIAASDPGRILVITPGPPARTRVLVTGSGGGTGGGTAGPAFAVTAAEFL
jgi:hypothetical protein